MTIEAALELLFWGIGAGGIVYSTWSLIRSLLARSWPSAVGEITRQRIEIIEDNEGDSYRARLEYEFRVNGKSYQGTRIAFGLTTWNIRWLVTSALAKATKDAPRIKVRYRVSNPEDSTILMGAQWFHLANLLFFFVWCWGCKHYEDHKPDRRDLDFIEI